MDRLKRADEAFEFNLRPDMQIATFLNRLEEVVKAHDTFMSQQLRRNRISLFHGRARFHSPTVIEMETVDGGVQQFTTDTIILATGSSPRSQKEIPAEAYRVAALDIIKQLATKRSINAAA